MATPRFFHGYKPAIVLGQIKVMCMKVFNNQKGFALVTTYLLFAALTIGASATFTRSYVYMREAEKQKNAIIALEMAEAGVDQAIVQLASNSAYTGASYSDFSSGNAKGGYTIAVSTPAGAPANVRQIAVTGYSPSNTATEMGYKASTVNVYTEFPNQNYFTNAVFAKSDLTISGSPTIDSYSSSSGYDPATSGTNGDVGSNSIAAGGITVSGTAVVIKGDVIVGAGGDPATAVDTSGSPTITGSVSAQDTNMSFETPATELESSGALTVRRGAMTLAAGTYHYSSLTITGTGILQTSGEVTIYVSGNISISGNGFAGSGSIPANLKVYNTGAGDVDIAGNAAMHAVIYAPDSNVVLRGTGDIFGAVVGETVDVQGNGEIHYDEDLADVGGGVGGDPELLAWVQSGNGAWTN